MEKSREDVFSLFSKPIRKEIKTMEWKKPTRIQQLAIPVILRGENALLIAPTGTGKTEAAIFPIFEKFVRTRGEKQLHGISILYITPLRALNRDILRRLIEIGEHLDIDVQVRHGDTVSSTRRMQALKPPNMLITTPETLQAILPGKRMQQHLRNVRWVIVDEIHEIATDKRGAQLSIGLERLRKLTNMDFQRVGLSATIGNPELMANFLSGGDSKARIIKAPEIKNLEVWVESPTANNEDEKIAKRLMMSAGSIGRIRRLLELIRDYKSTLIFTNTREHAEALASRIHALKPSTEVGVHHGSLSRELRIDIEKGIKEGELKAVVCTSSLELGIDIGSIEFIAQYMSPRQVTKLVQRIGRSGHIIGATAKGCIVAAWPDDILEAAVISKFTMHEFLEEPKIHENALDVLAHQIAGVALDQGRITLSDAYDIVKKAWPYRSLSLESFVAVVRQLEREGVVWLSGDLIKKRVPRNFRYYFENLSMIPDVKRYDVFDFISRRKIGVLDQEFIAKNGKPGIEFIIHGQTWRILSVDEEKRVAQVEPVYQSLGAIPSWEGEIIPVPFEVAQEAGKLRDEIAKKILANQNPLPILKGYPLNEEAAGKAVDIIRRQIEGEFEVPTHNRIVIECFENFAVIHACFGDLVNEALSKALAAILSSRVGINIATQSDPYRIALIAPIPLDPKVLKQELLQLRPEEVDLVLTGTLSETSLFAWRLWHVAKRFGVVEHDAEYRSTRAHTLVNLLRETPIHWETLREIYTEKLDVEGAKKVLKMLENREIEVKIVYKPREYSPLALPILDKIAPQDILRPVTPLRAIIDIVKERLESEQVRLVCVFRGDYDGLRTVRSLSDKIRCPKCGSTLIATTYPSDDDLVKIAKKRMSKQKTTDDEEKKWLTAWKNASLVQNYGKKAVVALAARGIGPTTAVRILRKHHKTEQDFYADILLAEREYLRTRMFWD